MGFKQSVVACLLAAASLPAAQITLEIKDSGVLPPEGGDISFSVPRFNPALGRFVSMEVHLSAGLRQTATFTNPYDTRATFTFGGYPRLFVADRPPLDFIAGDGTLNGYTLDLDAFETRQFDVWESSYKIFFYEGAAPAEFVGMGAFKMDATVWLNILEDDGQFPPDELGNLTWTADEYPYSYVTYEFQPVPEPSTIGLSLLGLGFLLYRLKRRRAMADN